MLYSSKQKMIKSIEKNYLNQNILWGVSLIASVVITPSAHASVSTINCNVSDYCTLTELVNGGSIQTNNVNWDNFIISDLSMPSLELDNILVYGLDNINNPGLDFQSINNAFTRDNMGDIFASLNYQVIDSENSIIGTSLNLNGYDTPGGNEFIAIMEDFTANTGEANLFAVEVGAGENNPTDSQGLTIAANLLNVNLSLNLQSQIDSYSLDSFENRVSLISQTPESNSTLGLLILGAFGLGSFLTKN